MELGVVLAVIAIGFIHGVLPDHGWPIAATYALNRQRRWLYGFLAALILGVGHLVSSVVLVLAYFWFSTFADFADGPWLGYVAGTLLILLGIHEYRTGGHGHGIDGHEDDHEDGHGHGDNEHTRHTDGGRDGPHVQGQHDEHEDEHTDGHEHEHGHGHSHTHEHGDDRGLLARIRGALPGGGGHQHLTEEHAERGLMALGTTALLLGFAHEEPVQILAICSGAGTELCLELMLVYSLAVIVAIILPTLLLIAGYEHHRERIERYTPYLPTITAVVLVGMGLAFIVGIV
ncbi:ABC transporter permease [Natronorubrum sp. JWXQ-INN-674]|uniref:ABC transporter permease n=1 Tax=Natronorubrum halalkaliphilum TaxID=2691917 RepID=A0A6B0VPL2_9EURY|nr:ABC transporter permease [Natronorubrum halalkaliphilum]MXV62926.1 ABC transporter permease [Natronorubrum halalkaliphilum]